MRTLIIHNPKSGFGSDAIFQFERALVRQGDECTFRMLPDRFEATEAIVGAGDYDLVVASGGDGTVSELLFALRDVDVPVCVFPSGTANLLCANIGNAPEPQALARACRVGHTAAIDLGQMTWEDAAGEQHSRGFAQMSGTGVDAQIMRAAIPNKAAMGQAAYYVAAMSALHPTVARFRITVDGEVHEREGISCLVANNAMIQGDIEVIPDCRMDDGLIDVIVIETDRTARLLRPLAFCLVDRSGQSIGRPYLESFRGRDVRVESSEPMPLEIDGEVVEGDFLWYEAHVVPGAVDVVVDTLSRYCTDDDPRPRYGGTEVVPYPQDAPHA